MSIVSSDARVEAAAFVVGLSLAGPQAPGVAAALRRLSNPNPTRRRPGDDLILLRELMRQRRKHLTAVIDGLGHRP